MMCVQCMRTWCVYAINAFQLVFDEKFKEPQFVNICVSVYNWIYTSCSSFIFVCLDCLRFDVSGMYIRLISGVFGLYACACACACVVFFRCYLNARKRKPYCCSNNNRSKFMYYIQHIYKRHPSKKQTNQAHTQLSGICTSFKWMSVF